ncbi:hypothetical protein C0992_001184 [Termitomyces sp. T32_za158]|nr:hypothetical protein C0992_001184 [Termitomyces sp. T32_za158]
MEEIPAKPQHNYFSNTEAQEPLLAGGSSGAGGYYDQPGQGDVPDDFKYGTTVSDSSPEVRSAFVRKVYTILRECPLVYVILDLLMCLKFAKL